ncbi:MAG: DUF6241 domain-containing protein [Bacillota bacterium]|nr:DUF6241 domain-containing protein [Bacillota bacterium]
MKKIIQSFNWIQRIMVFGAILSLVIFYCYSTGLFKFGKAAVTVNEQTINGGGTVIKLTETNSKAADEYTYDMSEDDVMSAIHEMSHQKVYADKKWGAIPLTLERVNRLILVVEKNKDKYHHYDLYLRILERWSKNDFSSAVRDHNDIWTLLGGTVGKATGKMTPEDEKAYIQDNFKTGK